MSLGAGRRRQLAGESAERVVSDLLSAVGHRWLVVWWRVDSAGRRVASGEWVPVRKSGPDFIGVLRDGRVLALEVKSAGAGVLRTESVRPHQLADLLRVCEAGGVGVLGAVHQGMVYAVEPGELCGDRSAVQLRQPLTEYLDRVSR